VGLPRLYAIVDVAVCAREGWAPLDLARACLDAGVLLLQLRAKDMPGGPLVELARRLQADAAQAGAQLVINDRADVAAIVGAAGVHVGQDDLAVPDARIVAGKDALVGISTHTEAQITDALEQSPSYLAVGPTFATGTKDTGYAAVGIPLVSRATRAAAAQGVPVVAIGGITLETAPSVIAAGAASVAVISDLFAGGDPARRARAYLTALA
jgi:thiamine-phosphate pyrophosphorylase